MRNMGIPRPEDHKRNRRIDWAVFIVMTALLLAIFFTLRVIAKYIFG